MKIREPAFTLNIGRRAVVASLHNLVVHLHAVGVIICTLNWLLANKDGQGLAANADADTIHPLPHHFPISMHEELLI